jgi:hypothetical protein
MTRPARKTFVVDQKRYRFSAPIRSLVQISIGAIPMALAAWVL